MTIGEKIKKIRTFRGMTQKEFVPKRDMLEQMAAVLRVSPINFYSDAPGCAEDIMQTFFWLDEDNPGGGGRYAMKMPPAIDTAFFAPCGMNCMVCYKHCYVKKPCAGCLPGDEGKPEHCRKCKIKDCVQEKGLTYCYECDTFPCKLIKNLEKSYNQRYGESLMKSSLFVKEYGLTSFMEKQLERYTCTSCGGVISLHDAECSECQTKTK